MSDSPLVVGTTSVPAPAFTDRGFVPPEDGPVLDGAIADFQAAFGGRLNFTNLETPRGQLVSSLAAIIIDKDGQFCALANGVDPAYASGRMQDAIARIYVIYRKAGETTSVTARCTGRPGTVIPTGALAQALDLHFGFGYLPGGMERQC